MIIFCFCVFFWNLASVCVSAENAAFIASAPQVRTRDGFVRRRHGFAVVNLGQRPRARGNQKTRALKAQFTAQTWHEFRQNVASEIENQPLDESRFQRLFEHRSNSWGDAPG